MKKITSIICLFAILLLSCKTLKKQQSTHNTNNTETYKNNQDTIIVSEINSTQIPASIKYEGHIKNIFRWKDKSGENIVITTETGIHRSNKLKHELKNGRDAELYAYRYLIKNKNAKQIWKVYDAVNDCPIDIVAAFIPNTFKVTDLNKNGTAEVWLVYRTGCRGGASPSDMSIIMHEGEKKYVMYGQTKVQTHLDSNGKPVFMGGDYRFNEAFKESPMDFINYAIKMWNENKLEKYN